MPGKGDGRRSRRRLGSIVQLLPSASDLQDGVYLVIEQRGRLGDGCLHHGCAQVSIESRQRFCRISAFVYIDPAFQLAEDEAGVIQLVTPLFDIAFSDGGGRSSKITG